MLERVHVVGDDDAVDTVAAVSGGGGDELVDIAAHTRTHAREMCDVDSSKRTSK